jgi:uncharacterized protein (TIGR00369 family)
VATTTTDPAHRAAPEHAFDEQLTALLHDQMPLTRQLGFVAVRGDRSQVIVEGEWAGERCTAGGVLHGGYLMALADSAGAACAALHLPAGASTSTIESKTNFVRAVRRGVVRATATPVHVGTTTIVVQTDVERADGRLVSRTTQTQAVISAR